MNRFWYWVTVDCYGEGRFAARTPAIPNIVVIQPSAAEAISVVGAIIAVNLHGLEGAPRRQQPRSSCEATAKEVGRYQICIDIPIETSKRMFNWG